MRSSSSHLSTKVRDLILFLSSFVPSSSLFLIFATFSLYLLSSPIPLSSPLLPATTSPHRDLSFTRRSFLVFFSQNLVHRISSFLSFFSFPELGSIRTLDPLSRCVYIYIGIRFPLTGNRFARNAAGILRSGNGFSTPLQGLRDPCTFPLYYYSSRVPFLPSFISSFL